jgi:hypothetical protein
MMSSMEFTFQEASQLLLAAQNFVTADDILRLGGSRGSGPTEEAYDEFWDALLPTEGELRDMRAGMRT